MGKRGAQFAFLHFCIHHFNITFSLLAKISFVSVSPFTTRSIIHKLSSFVVHNIIESIWNVITFFNVALPTQTKRHCPVLQPLGELVSTDKFEALTNSTGRTSPKQGLWEFLVLPENQQLAVRETCDKSQHCQKSKHCSARYLHSPYSHTKGAFTARKQFLHNLFTTSIFGETSKVVKNCNKILIFQTATLFFWFNQRLSFSGEKIVFLNERALEPAFRAADQWLAQSFFSSVCCKLVTVSNGVLPPGWAPNLSPWYGYVYWSHWHTWRGGREYGRKMTSWLF